MLQSPIYLWWSSKERVRKGERICPGIIANETLYQLSYTPRPEGAKISRDGDLSATEEYHTRPSPKSSGSGLETASPCPPSASQTISRLAFMRSNRRRLKRIASDLVELPRSI